MKPIPILINNRDILDSLVKQIEFFRECPNAYIVICDNLSSYPPLLDWYYQMTGRHRLGPHPFEFYKGRSIQFYFFPKNRGPRGAQTILHRLMFDFDYYFMSDVDMDYGDCDPSCFLMDLINGLNDYPDSPGCGVSIRINDLPNTPLLESVKTYESDKWKEHPHRILHGDYSVTDQFDDRWWVAGCDTAGVMRRYHPAWDGSYGGLRSTKHIARHRPWYFTPKNRPSDFAWYYARAEGAGTTYTSKILDLEKQS